MLFVGSKFISFIRVVYRNRDVQTFKLQHNDRDHPVRMCANLNLHIYAVVVRLEGVAKNVASAKGYGLFLHVTCIVQLWLCFNDSSGCALV